MAKLTLNVDDEVVSRAKLFAKSQGMSVSQIVEAYLSTVSKSLHAPAPNAPVLRSLLGVLKSANVADYRKHLSSKYR